MHEFHTRHWCVRYASVLEPRVANGLRSDRRVFRDRGGVVEGELDYEPHGHPGAVRFLGYFNRTDSGRYADALKLGEETNTTPDITLVHRAGTLKYGSGISVDREMVKDIAVFGRWGWNNGQTQSVAFTAMDRLYDVGVSVTASRWHRPNDVAATGIATGGWPPSTRNTWRTAAWTS
jgi:hypothetical protein